MSSPIKNSPHIERARELLRSVHGKSLSLAEREKNAIELAAHLLREALRIQTFAEKRTQQELARMMRDPRGKAFTTSMTDQCFRSQRAPRIANQLLYLLRQFGIPRYLYWVKKAELSAFQMLGGAFSYVLVPLVKRALRKATSAVILPGDPPHLSQHMQKRRAQGVRLNLNHLGEAILSEREALRRLDVYLKDLTREDVEYVSVKISTIFSQINLLAWDKTLEILSERLKLLYEVCLTHTFTRANGTKAAKFVNLDMEEYRDLFLTKELFKKVLSEPRFLSLSAGIVLQAYLPDAFAIQKELTTWARERMKQGGAPIKIRIVKGANLSMEQVESSLKDWPQAPYHTKIEVDANYKRMVSYALLPEHAKAVHIGIASHNLFDIAFALLLREENAVRGEVSFEMLEGMADHLRRALQHLTHDILLYCPVATKDDFQSAVAYLIRRLDENTGPDNFLRHTFGLKPHTEEWDAQAGLFTEACKEISTVSHTSNRKQSRLDPPVALALDASFENEADTDFSLPPNRAWAEEIRKNWQHRQIPPLPLVIGGNEIHHPHAEGKGYDPSHPGKVLYTYSLATWNEIDTALQNAREYESGWADIGLLERARLLSSAAESMRKRRGDLLGVMMADGGKALYEGDPEVSEAIDFAEYYCRNAQKMAACTDILWKPKGSVLVTPPWNFPISIPTGGILAALVMGNCVLFKPAPEAVLSGWVLVNALWDAGIPRKALQFINCVDDPIGSRLIADPRISMVILTGATSTSRLFLRMCPCLDLAAETGGKNALIITAMADRDLAIKDLLQSAFGHSGQKCSAASLAILEAEVYDDPHFRAQLCDAVQSLSVGSPWDPASKVVPLIHPATDPLLRGLTSLDKGEEWLVKPEQDAHNPQLWSPGVKWGVKERSFMHQTELFGPILGVMRAKNLEHAIQLANGTPYGLTAGIHTLDEREQRIWLEKIETGNCYINRSITGAVVQRQPFGGCKASSFGSGAKAGGPNYLAVCALPTQIGLPQEKCPLGERVNKLTKLLDKMPYSAEELGIWYGSIANYAYWSKRFKQDHDPSKILGQDNLFRYRPHTGMALRIQKKDLPLDLLRTLAAALSVEVSLEVSWTREETPVEINDQWPHLMPTLLFVEEPEESFVERLHKGAFKRVRFLSKPSPEMQIAAAESAIYLATTPVLANGRFELLHFLREIAISIDYHRYGNLGVREGELRKPLL